MKRYRQLFIYGVALAALLVLLQVLEYRLLIMQHAMEIYISAIALVFKALGIGLAQKLTNRRCKPL